MWIGVIVASLAVFAIKYSGYSLPARIAEHDLVVRGAALVTVALLAALVGLQSLVNSDESGTVISADARIPAIGVAVVALLLRAPFIVVIAAAAFTAAVVRALGWAA